MPTNDSDDLVSMRDRAALMLGLFAGLRTGEMHRRRWRDVDLDHGLIEVIGKAAKPGSACIAPQRRAHLNLWRAKLCRDMQELGALPVLPQVGRPAGRAEHVLREPVRSAMDQGPRTRGLMMTDAKAPWPMGESDGRAPTPLIFNPKGFLVLILEDEARALKAQGALMKGGLGEDDVRVYTSQQILDDHEAYLANQSTARRVVRAVTTDPETPELYFGYARAGRSALWVRVADRDEASRMIRTLVDCPTLHIRLYGHDGSQEDMHVR
jgi:hypothetical protein